jgi:hypothetical protein
MTMSSAAFPATKREERSRESLGTHESWPDKKMRSERMGARSAQEARLARIPAWRSDGYRSGSRCTHWTSQRSVMQEEQMVTPAGLGLNGAPLANRKKTVPLRAHCSAAWKQLEAFGWRRRILLATGACVHRRVVCWSRNRDVTVGHAVCCCCIRLELLVQLSGYWTHVDDVCVSCTLGSYSKALMSASALEDQSEAEGGGCDRRSFMA